METQDISVSMFQVITVNILPIRNGNDYFDVSNGSFLGVNILPIRNGNKHKKLIILDEAHC